MFARLLSAVALAALSSTAASAQSAPDERSKVTLLFDHALPNVPGKSIRGVLVDYKGGGSTPPHTHPASASISVTVLEGAVRSKVNDGPERVYRAGESFHEMPGDHHGVSANASETEPARLLAVFVLDSSETSLLTPDKK